MLYCHWNVGRMIISKSYLTIHLPLLHDSFFKPGFLVSSLLGGVCKRKCLLRVEFKKSASMCLHMCKTRSCRSKLKRFHCGTC